MIRSQKPTVHSQSSKNETIQSPSHAGAIASYIGKILTLHHTQFVVEDILGQGGSAFVFLVRSFNQRRFALKRMYVNNQHDLHVCQREISIVKEFSSHRNIIKYVDSFIHRLPPTNIQRSQYYAGGNKDEENDDDTIYEILLLTEYCSNGPLVAHLHERRHIDRALDERNILRIFADICVAVSACHYRRPQPILHRDIKLENILIDSHHNYVLCDFGSAVLLPPSATNNHQQYQLDQLTTNVIQQIEEEIQRYTTLSYRAPEMIDLYSRLPLTLKIDIWAMGCLLYKLMYNMMPFGDSILAIQNGTFVIPDDMAQSYRRELNLLVRYMLEIDINKRPDIWQVSYTTYKLLGIECPIPNRCQSKIPNLNAITMPLTDSESRQQRTAALANSKSISTITMDESASFGTAVNPRERPRGMITSSTPLINFNQENQRSSANVASIVRSSNAGEADSAGHLTFDDDFSKIPSHAISLTNISTVATATTEKSSASSTRPSPPVTISAASSRAVPQQLLSSAIPSRSSSSFSSSNAHMHRRSSSQIVNPTSVQSSFQAVSSTDLCIRHGTSDTDSAPLKTSVRKLEGCKDSTTSLQSEASEKQRFSSVSDHNESMLEKNTNIKSQLPMSPKHTTHRSSIEEAKYNDSSLNSNTKNFVEPIVQHSSGQQDESIDDLLSDLFNPCTTNQLLQETSRVTNTRNNFDQFLDKDSDHGQGKNQNAKRFDQSSALKYSSNEHNDNTNSSLIAKNNPFLCAHLHHIPTTKQTSASSTINTDRILTTVNLISFDSNSNSFDKRASAFVPYQKHIVNSQNYGKSPHSESSVQYTPDNQSSLTTDVFANAPFNTKFKSKQRGTTSDKKDTRSPRSSLNFQLIDLNLEEESNKSPQNTCSNLSVTDSAIDKYF